MINVKPGFIKTRGLIKGLALNSLILNDYWGSNPLVKKPGFVNPGLTLYNLQTSTFMASSWTFQPCLIARERLLENRSCEMMETYRVSSRRICSGISSFPTFRHL